MAWAAIRIHQNAMGSSVPLTLRADSENAGRISAKIGCEAELVAS
jgi:hypothetical protein